MGKDGKFTNEMDVLMDNYPLVITNIAMGNGQFIDGLPIQGGDFPWLC